LAEPGFVSAALAPSAGPLAERVRHVVAVIDGVHRVGSLPRIPIDHRIDVPGADGQCRFNRRNGQARGIGLSRDAPSPEFVLLHEFGHFIDHQALGNRGGFASSRHPDLADWRRVVARTRTYQALVRVKRARERIGRDVDRVAYLLDYNELWSRSYAQYVTVQSQDAMLLLQLAQESTIPRPLRRLVQWDRDDFFPILDAIDVPFHRKGWRP